MKEIKLIGIDIGQPARTGATKIVSDGLDIIGGGTDIWNAADQFHFAYLTHSGDFNLIARIESLSSADLYSKAGIMARETLEPSSKHGYIMAFPDNNPRNSNNGGFEFQYRVNDCGESKAIYPSDYTREPPLFPVNFPNTWIRLVRIGDKFDSYYSATGIEWSLYSSFTLKLISEIYLGFAVTSHNDKETVTAQFRAISLE